MSAEEIKEKNENEVQVEAVKSAVTQALQVLEEESGGTKQYDQQRSVEWIRSICEDSLRKLISQRKAYKFVVNVVIARRTGAGLHVCSSAYFGQADGSYTHTLELAPAHLHAIVTVFWTAI